MNKPTLKEFINDTTGKYIGKGMCRNAITREVLLYELSLGKEIVFIDPKGEYQNILYHKGEPNEI